jgi:hypothetical protein
MIIIFIISNPSSPVATKHKISTEDGDRSSLRNVVVFCKTSTYQTMDRVEKKPNSSVQRTPSSESFQANKIYDFISLFYL